MTTGAPGCSGAAATEGVTIVCNGCTDAAAATTTAAAAAATTDTTGCRRKHKNECPRVAQTEHLPGVAAELGMVSRDDNDDDDDNNDDGGEKEKEKGGGGEVKAAVEEARKLSLQKPGRTAGSTSVDPTTTHDERQRQRQHAANKPPTEGGQGGDPCAQAGNERGMLREEGKAGAESFLIPGEAGKNGMGSKWTLKTLQKRLAGMGVDVPVLWGDIHDVVIKTLIAIEAQVKA